LKRKGNEGEKGRRKGSRKDGGRQEGKEGKWNGIASVARSSADAKLAQHASHWMHHFSNSRSLTAEFDRFPTRFWALPEDVGAHRYHSILRMHFPISNVSVLI